MARPPKRPAPRKPAPGTDADEFDPMAVKRPLPKFDEKTLGVVRLMFQGGAEIGEVAAFLDVDILTVEELIEAKPQLRPKPPESKSGAGSQGGRPTAYKKKFADQARILASLGATDLEQAQFFEVSIRTLHRWKIDHPAFREALELGKEQADAKVEQSLYKRAVGYTFDSEKHMVVDGELVRVETMEHVPPDTKAALAWLYNRRPDAWRTVNHIKHDVEPEGELAGWFRDLSKNKSTLQPVEDDPDSGAGVVASGMIPIAEDDEG